MKKETNTAYRTNRSPLPSGGAGGGFVGLLFLELVIITLFNRLEGKVDRAGRAGDSLCRSGILLKIEILLVVFLHRS